MSGHALTFLLWAATWAGYFVFAPPNSTSRLFPPGSLEANLCEFYFPTVTFWCFCKADGKFRQKMKGEKKIEVI